MTNIIFSNKWKNTVNYKGVHKETSSPELLKSQNDSVTSSSDIKIQSSKTLVVGSKSFKRETFSVWSLEDCELQRVETIFCIFHRL